ICVYETASWQSGMTLSFVRNELRGLDYVSEIAVLEDNTDNHGALLPDGMSEVKVQVKPVDDGFFKVYDFNFIEGTPFTPEDIDGEVMEAIISDQAAELIFGKESEYVGKTLTLDQIDYRVKGVVEAASPMTPMSFSQIYVPVLKTQSEINGNLQQRLCGRNTVVMLIEDGKRDEVRAQIDRKLQALSEGTEWKASIDGEAAPLSHLQNVFMPYARQFSWWEALKGNLLVLLVLLIVPAMNLAGLISGRMDARVGELGLRKAFGAEKKTLISMVVSENLVYTLIGGVLGLLLAFVIVLVGRMSLFEMLSGSFANTSHVETISVSFRPEMFLSFSVFGVTLAICIILNVLSALIPALISVRRPITDSLNQKK
ncbi:MAG: ABC transporter permease, partial [Muribaculaceae bacterium]|nr:ABC transporter permease [Muribaculaceae bacterium]